MRLILAALLYLLPASAVAQDVPLWTVEVSGHVDAFTVRVCTQLDARAPLCGDVLPTMNHIVSMDIEDVPPGPHTVTMTAQNPAGSATSDPQTVTVIWPLPTKPTQVTAVPALKTLIYGGPVPDDLDPVPGSAPPTPAPVPAPAPGGSVLPSPEGTQGPTLVDSAHQTWTIRTLDGAPLRDGVPMGGGYGVTAYRWQDGTVYVLTTAGTWYAWVNEQWTPRTPVVAP